MARNGGAVDRLSALPDHVLGHILSFLSVKAAGRAAVLSTRWRYMFAHVHTLSFQAEKRYNFWSDAITFYLDSEERRSTNGNFLDTVNEALLARRRCAGCLAGNATTPLRVFRVAFHIYQHWDEDMVSMWVYHALQQSEQELHLDLRLHTYRPCEIGDGRRSKKRFSYDEEDDGRSEDGFSSNEEDDSQSGEDMDFGEEEEDGVWKGWSFSFPRPLFTSSVLRSLRLSHCRCLDLPAAIVLPSLETLHLTAVIDSERAIQRLISGCPRLADLTLESCSKLTRVSVLDTQRLRRLALLCCHSVVSVSLDASELRFLHYRGAVPAASLFAFHGSPRIHSGIIDFCGPNQSSEEELAAFRLLLESFKHAKHLHLNVSQLGCSDGSKFLMCFPAFHSLQKLKLSGCLDSHSITRVLQQTPNLEVLSLFLVPDPENRPVAILDAPPPVLCLEHRLIEIKLVHYQGSDEQRTLAQLLLGSALVLQTLRVVFHKKTLELNTTLMAEIKRWVVSSKSPKMTFLQS